MAMIEGSAYFISSFFMSNVPKADGVVSVFIAFLSVFNDERAEDGDKQGRALPKRGA